jgi:surfeit locus 1 family protein
MRRGYSFRPRLWSFALALAACAAGIALGNWQAGRAEEKRGAGAKELRAEVRGTFLERHTILLDNKLHRGRTGYHVVQPLRLAAPAAGTAQHVLVNRGWIAAGPRRDALPAVRTPAGEIVVEGVRRERFQRAMDAGPPAGGIVWQNASVDAFAAWSKLSLAPWVIEQHSPADDGLVREWPRSESGVEKHESYSLQWYALAALSGVLFIVLSFRRNGPPAR